MNYFKNKKITKNKLKLCGILIEDFSSNNFLKKLNKYKNFKIKIMKSSNFCTSKELH